ncbi:MAG: MFS transporter [Acidibacter sp.]|nr:MFS transporter [Acidibacter sp.]
MSGSSVEVATRWSWRDRGVLLLLSLAILFDGMDNQVLGLVAPAILAEWQFDKSTFAPVLAVGQFGMMIGTLLGGLWGDRVGRKQVLLCCVFLFGAATLAMSFVGTVESLFLLRVVAGIGMGGALPNAAALAAECTPPRYRVVAVTATIVCIPLGGVVGGALAAEILPAQGWRAMMHWAGVLPLVLLLVLWRGLPNDLPRDALSAAVSGEPISQIRALLSPDRRRDTLALWCAFGFCLMAIYASFSWLPTMLVEAGRDIAEASRGLMYFNLGGVITALLAAGLMTRYGSRKPLALMAGLAAALSVVFLLGDFDGASTELVLVLLALLGGCINGVQTTLYALAAHLYPAPIRATGIGAASSIGRLGGVSSAFFGAALLTAFGGAGFFVLLFVAMCVTLLALLVLRNHIQRVPKKTNTRDLTSAG